MTPSTRIVALLDLAFGDCGKGMYTDFLARHWGAHTVVRFNGGAQAGHNVVLADGRHHTFSQFGAGSFVPGVATILAAPVVVHPSALLVEAQALQAAGVPDALRRLAIDGRCRVTTPYHQAAGRLRELARGDQAHGTCGVGVGETVLQGLLHAADALVYADLAQPGVARDKLERVRRALHAEFAGASGAERAVLDDPAIGKQWLNGAQLLVRAVPPATREDLRQRLSMPGTVLFEGAQGVLLDEWRGFHPHTTWSSITTAAVEDVLRDLDVHADVQHFGLLRTYMTRHGHGPLPTFDPRLDCLAEPHNASAGWQGRFRRGHFDGVLLDYALAVAGTLDGLLVTHVDALTAEARLRWCDQYDVPATGPLARLQAAPRPDLAHQVALAELLRSVQPRYAPDTLTAGAFLARLEDQAGLPVAFYADGPCADDVHRLHLRF